MRFSIGAVFVCLLGCSADPRPQAAARWAPGATTELDAAQCQAFDVNGKDTICHATGSAKNPFVIIQVSDSACVNAHAQHAHDYIAIGDPTCQGLGCLPINAPCDATAPCCGDLGCQSGICACSAGQTACGTQCVDTSSDTNNCGGCGIVCPAGNHTCQTGVCKSAYAKEVLADAPTGYWRLGDAAGSAIAADSSGNGYDGAVVSGTINFGVSGLISDPDTAAFFPGSGYVSVPNPVSNAFAPNGPFSIELWINPLSDEFMVEKYDVPGYRGYYFRITSGKLMLGVADDAFGGVVLWNTPVALNVTHHFVATVDAGALATLYADGVAVASAKVVLPKAGLYTNTVQIGARGDDKCCHLNGTLDEVAFYNGQALSPARVAAHYAAGQ